MRVLVGVCGGVAAYKAAELVRELQRRGVEVQVAMTASAEEFVRPLTFAALTGRQVLGSLWQPEAEASRGEAPGSFEIEHIAVGQKIDLLVVAPATAKMLAKMASGLADDFLSTLYLATTVPVIVAPAMNVNMWGHPATRENVRRLEERGVEVVAPDAGYLACGMVGSGRLAEVLAIADAVMRRLERKRDMHGEHVLVTAGGTREPVDAVRFLGNRSSGKMGHAVAEEAAARGARVTLVTASGLPAAGCEVVRVETAAEMRSAVMEALGGATVVVMAAAVSDFRVRGAVAAGKLRRGAGVSLELEPTEDILAEVVVRRGEGTVVVGFAAEVEDAVPNGRSKLQRKGADALLVNDVSRAGIGFDAERNAGWWVTAAETVEMGESSKREMAAKILDRVKGLRAAAGVGAGVGLVSG